MTTSSKNTTQKRMGGKAYNLARLEEFNIRVPDWTVISDAEIENSTDQQLEEKVKKYFGESTVEMNFAVRSSASCEDGDEHSFAGLFESKLNIRFQSLAEVIRLIRNSKNSSRVQSYLKAKKIEEEVQLNVIVQELIDPDVAGVAFGQHPFKKGSKAKVINAVFGLGQALVDGTVNADTYEIEEKSIESKIAHKHIALVSTLSGGLEEQELTKEKANSPCLTRKQILEIEEILDFLALNFECPQDIEFAYKNGNFYLLQTRPITQVFSGGEYIVWDNSNIIESYPGMVSPLTFSFIIKMYDFVYKQLVLFLGASPKHVKKHEKVFAQTLGWVRGRVYYNLLSWYKMLSMAPGYSLNAQYMEQMMGVKERFELGDEFKLGKGQARFRIVYMVYKIIRAQIQLPKQRRAFLNHLNKVMMEYKNKDFSALSLEEVVAEYRRFEQSLLLEWKAPLVNDFFAMIWFGLLKSQCEKLMGKQSNIHNDLLCGSQDIISVEPLHESLRISEKIYKNSVLRSLFEQNTPERILELLKEEKYSDIKDEVFAYIDRFGDRCIGELKLESISYTQSPELYIKLLKNYVEQKIFTLHHDNNIEKDIREKAEALVQAKLKGPIKKWWFNYTLNKARDMVSNRENLRYERTRAFGMVRKIFLAMGEKLQDANVIENHRDVFYLKLEELLDLSVKSDTNEVKNLIIERKSEFAHYKDQENPSERFFTYGNNFSDEYIYSSTKLENVHSELSGIGCCPGRVRAKVMVIDHPENVESLDGCILVTSSTDPGWVTLFPSASGILVERGSLLSHSAIVSREMGIPCIVSIDGLLRSLKTGDEVIMDGQTGEIIKLHDGQ